MLLENHSSFFSFISNNLLQLSNVKHHKYAARSPITQYNFSVLKYSSQEFRNYDNYSHSQSSNPYEHFYVKQLKNYIIKINVYIL